MKQRINDVRFSSLGARNNNDDELSTEKEKGGLHDVRSDR